MKYNYLTDYLYYLLSVVFIFCISIFSFGYIEYINPWFLICSYSLIYFSSCLVCKDPFSAPIFYGYFIYFYTISYPVYVYLVDGYSYNTSININIIIISGMLFYSGVLFSHAGYRTKDVFNDYKLSKGRSYVINLYLLLFGLFFILNIYSAISSNVEYKYDLETTGLSSVMSYFFILFSFVFLYYNKSNFYFLSLVFLSAFLLYYLTTGERDMFVRFFLMILFTAYLRKSINKSLVLFIIFFGFFSIPLSQSMKGFLSYGSHIVENDSFLISLFSGEFYSQGRNFNYMLIYNDRMLYYYDNMIVSDILRFFKVIDYSSSSLFGEHIVGRNGGAGIGFTLLGQIYFSFGLSGLFFFGLLIGYLLRFLRLIVPNSPLYVYIYITFIFGSSYSLRADFANLLANTIKLGLAPVLLLVFSEKIFNKVNNKNLNYG